jgi:hypothetical protein
VILSARLDSVLHPMRRLDARALRRGVVAGAAWGVLFAFAIVALEAWRCGVVCLDAAAFLTVVSVAAGILTIGPLAALGRVRCPAPV